MSALPRPSCDSSPEDDIEARGNPNDDAPGTQKCQIPVVLVRAAPEEAGVSKLAKAKEPSGDDEALLAESVSYRHNGNRLFQTSHFLPALDAYTVALSKCPDSFPIEKATIYGNISAVQIRLQDPAAAAKAASKALKLRPGWAKALYRRGKGREGMGGWAGLVGAYDDYSQLLEMEVNGRVEGIRAEELETAKEKVRWLPERIEECRKKEVEGVVAKMSELET